MSGIDSLTYKEFYGKERAKAIKQKLSISQRKPKSEYFKKGQVPWNKGKKMPEKQRQEHSEDMKRWHKNNPEKLIEIGKKRGISQRKFYQNMRDNGTYEEYTKERGRRISKAKKGKKCSKEHKKALSENHWTKREDADEIWNGIKKKLRGRPVWNEGLTKETDSRIANHPASKPHSKEWNKKVSIALKNSEKMKECYKTQKFKDGCVKGAINARI